MSTIEESMARHPAGKGRRPDWVQIVGTVAPIRVRCPKCLAGRDESCMPNGALHFDRNVAAQGIALYLHDLASEVAR